MASGGSDIYLGTDVGHQRRRQIVFGLPKGKNFFSTPCVDTRNARIFVENSTTGGKTQKKIRPPDPTSKSALGCWLIHLLPVTGGGGGAARRVVDGLRTEVWGQQKQSNNPGNNQHNPQYANYWAPLTRKRHIPPHPAQPQHPNYWAPRTRKRHQQEHRPQRPTERSDPTQHAKGRTGDCPGPRKGTATRRNVTQGGGAGGGPMWCTLLLACIRPISLATDRRLHCQHAFCPPPPPLPSRRRPSPYSLLQLAGPGFLLRGVPDQCRPPVASTAMQTMQVPSPCPPFE